MFALVLMSACWSPDRERAPDLPPLEFPAAEPEDGAGGEPEPEEGDPTPDGAQDAADDAPPFIAYAAYTAGAPVTLVDDHGKTLCIVSGVGTPVEVRGDEDGIRKKVWCGKCFPAVEGWVQTNMVTRPGEPPPPEPSEPLPGTLPGTPSGGPPIGTTGAPELGPSGR